MKNLKWFVVLIITLITICSYTFADEPIKILVQLDGEYLSFVDEQGKEVLPQIINNRTMVPLRVIFESLGCDIDWNQETKTVTAVKNDTQISLTIDDVTAKVKNMPSGDEEQIVLDSAPVIIENRTLVPVRFIAESLDKKVSWVQESRTVVILDSEKLLSEIKTRVPHLQDILDLNLESINSFKSTGNLNATLDYQDKEDSTKNEKIDMKGTIDVISSGKDFQIDIDASASGKNGSIMNSLTSSGYDKFKYRIIIKDGKLYTGKYNGRIYEWQESADEVSTNKELEEVLGFSLDGLNVSNVNSTKFDSYESIVDFVTSQDADANTYANIISFFDFLGVVLSNDKVKINNTGTKTTIDFNFDLSQVLQKLIPDISESTLSAIKLVFSSSLTLNKNKVSTEKMNLEFVGDSEDSKEMIGFKASLDNKYKDINKVFLIEAPAF